MGVAIPEIPFEDLSLRIDAKRNRVPIEGALETTFRCNLRCAHCYVNEAAGDASEEARELPLARLEQLVDEIAERGCLFLLITGGEALLRPDFPELYRHAVSRGLLVIVYTNGTLVTERIADLFAEHRPHLVEISLYGMSRETYEKVTQIKGSYDKCIAGIERLVARHIPLRLKTMALTWNQHEVLAMKAYAASLGLGFRFDSFLNPRVDCGANRNGELQLSAEQAVALDLGDPERIEELRSFCEQHAMPSANAVPHEYVYTCGAGQTSFAIDPYGNLQLCQLSRRNGADVREESFASGWDGHFPKLRERKWQTQSVCRSCNLISLCASCPGAAEMENDDPEALVRQFCEITHLRAAAVMGAASGHRRDATCCLGEGRLAALPQAEAENQVAAASCGGCGHATPAQAPLIQIRRRPVAV